MVACDWRRSGGGEEGTRDQERAGETVAMRRDRNRERTVTAFSGPAPTRRTTTLHWHHCAPQLPPVAPRAPHLAAHCWFRLKGLVQTDGIRSDGQPMDRHTCDPLWLLSPQSFQVVRFSPAPSGENGPSELLDSVKRFGLPLYTLFLPSMVRFVWRA